MDNKDFVQYNFISPDLPEDFIEECVDIINNLDSRKVDKVNWEERRQMDEATKRSGKYILHEDDKQKKAPVSEQEQSLMDGLGDIMRHWEGLGDGKR